MVVLGVLAVQVDVGAGREQGQEQDHNAKGRCGWLSCCTTTCSGCRRLELSRTLESTNSWAFSSSSVLVKGGRVHG
jgi:hypothetical protein